MKKKLSLLFISALILTTSANANVDYSEVSDYTGDSFFSAPTVQENENVDKQHSSSGTTPPLKQLRLKMQENQIKKEQKEFELAPTASDIYSGEVETSQYASQEVEENFEESYIDNEFEVEEPNKKSFFKRKKRNIKDTEKTEDIVLDCDKVDYDTPNYLVKATGNVCVEFVKQKTKVKADIITFDRVNNTIKAEGNVRILKNGQTITGEYIFVDMNEENALIEEPLTRTETMEIRSKKGYVYGDKVVQEQGSIVVDKSFPMNFRSGSRGPKMSRMMVPKDETLTKDMENGIIKLVAQDIKITQKGDLEIISLKKARVHKGEKVIFKTPSVKLYTNKNHDFGETNHWEIGSYRGLGMYAGPGYVFELPKGSVLKAMPILNYKSGFGVGAYGRFSSGTNHTMMGYGTAASKVLVLGKQKLDDNLFLQYSVNSYMDEWFMGRRRPKYGASLVYSKGYASNNFLYKGHPSSYAHRFDAGYYHDLDFDSHFEKLSGSAMGTTRFRYMANASQNLFNYKNKDELKAFSLDIRGQVASSLYGTGDTQVIGRIGPMASMQYKRWKQDIGYLFSVYEDNSPMPVFDAYRYGKQALYIREYFRICRWLTLSWFGTINLSGDSPNGKDFQENSIYFSFGPDDIKFNLGYDSIRENLYCIVELMMDAKGTTVEYETLEIKKDNKAKKTAEVKPKQNLADKAPVGQRVLQKAVVEDIRVVDDVL